YSALITQRARMEGFIVFDYAQQYGKATEDMSKWIKEGKLKSRETVVHGIENAPSALIKLFKGDNTGKMLVKVAEEDNKSKL
ncbi:NADP-dependent leukotriene B4 12-hydroxydehydrogenase, partial [Dissophora ornata]